ncbi:MAG: hypothetical protein H0W38_20055 [Methylibium sp.]|nr:hypothetical protein [Methylibium sp.]
MVPTKAGYGGRRAGAGRKPGSANTKTREIADKAIKEGITPLEYMLKIMRTEPEPGLDARDLISACTLRFEAAKAAAPYIHPRLAAIEHSGGIDTTPQLNITLNR